MKGFRVNTQTIVFKEMPTSVPHHTVSTRFNPGSNRSRTHLSQTDSEKWSTDRRRTLNQAGEFGLHEEPHVHNYKIPTDGSAGLKNLLLMTDYSSATQTPFVIRQFQGSKLKL